VVFAKIGVGVVAIVGSCVGEAGVGLGNNVGLGAGGICSELAAGSGSASDLIATASVTSRFCLSLLLFCFLNKIKPKEIIIIKIIKIIDAITQYLKLVELGSDGILIAGSEGVFSTIVAFTGSAILPA
jgi:hypothetical protein